MENVKRTFFLTKEEAEQQRKITGNSYIDWQSPHYELENGKIVWGLSGGPAAIERWHDYKS